MALDRSRDDATDAFSRGIQPPVAYLEREERAVRKNTQEQ